MKTAMFAASLALVAGAAAGCGGSSSDSSTSSGASESEFCDGFATFRTDLQGSVTAGSDPADIVKAVKGSAQKLEGTGTPDGIPADAKEGFQISLDTIANVPDDATAQDFSKLGDSLSKADQAKADAFDSYLSDTCPDLQP